MLIFLAFSTSNARIVGIATIIGVWTNVILIGWFLRPVFGEGPQVLHFITGISIDRVAAVFIILTAIVTACALSHAHLFFKREAIIDKQLSQRHVCNFYILSLLFYISMLSVFVCDNLGYLWISIEATTLTSATLVYFNRNKHALEATWKYLIICSVGIAFALLGTVCFYLSSKFGAIEGGTLSFSELTRVAPGLEPTYIRLGFIFCFLGYGTKAGVFPLHSWLPDAHSEAPAPASAMLSGALLNCALFAIYRLAQIGHASNQFVFSRELLIFSGTLTVFSASIFLIRQHGIKRLWAYSSVENVGLMLVAIGFNAIPAFLLQVINHSLAKVALFLVSGDVIQHQGTKELSQIKGLKSTMPWRASLLIASAVAITGAPPFGAFIAEWMILSEAAGSGYWLVVFSLVISLSLAFIMVSFHTGRMLVGNSSVPTEHRFINCLIPLALISCSLVLGVSSGPAIIGIFK